MKNYIQNLYNETIRDSELGANMKHSLEKDRKYLRWNNRRGVAWTVGRGYFWFKQRYLPAVCRVERADRKKDRFLLSDCYYQIGDVNGFNNCPLAAIAAYKRSFDLDPTHAEALREMKNPAAKPQSS